MAFNIRVSIVVMETIIDRGALIIIRKARMLPIWVLLKMGSNKSGGMRGSNGAIDLTCGDSLHY